MCIAYIQHFSEIMDSRMLIIIPPTCVGFIERLLLGINCNMNAEQKAFKPLYRGRKKTVHPNIYLVLFPIFIGYISNSLSLSLLLIFFSYPFGEFTA